LEKEIEQASAYAGLLNDAFAKGDLQNKMLAMPAFHNVAAVELIGTLEVQNADAETDAPTQLSGSCRLSGIRLSEFLEPQRAAFKSAMAASSGAMEAQVVINDVSDNSARRHLRRRRLLLAGGDLVVQFAIVVERHADPETSSPPAAAQGLSPPAIAAITLVSISVALLLCAAAVVTTYMKLRGRGVRVGVVKGPKSVKHQGHLKTGPKSVKHQGPKSVEMSIAGKRLQATHSSSSMVVKKLSKYMT